jgi:hypothetical protein
MGEPDARAFERLVEKMAGMPKRLHAALRAEGFGDTRVQPRGTNGMEESVVLARL